MMSQKTSMIRVSMTLGIFALLSVGAVSMSGRPSDPASHYHTDTPIKHLVVIFQENVSFDHYFATYPKALNTTAGEPKFFAKPGTPSVNNLESAGLLTSNPNSVNPFRLGRNECVEYDNDHGYTDEQAMFHGGLMDMFIQDDAGTPDPKSTMAYFDGNTVTAIWNYAQHFAMSDNHYGTTFGPSTPGALNVICGQTHGAVVGTTPPGGASDVVADGHGGWTVINDAQPTGDIATTRDNVSMLGKNIGNLLSAKGITWGWFTDGFLPPGGFIGKGLTHTSPTPVSPLTPILSTPAGGRLNKVDYIPHHAAFQYFPSTANPKHLPPLSVSEVGHDGQANHNYDLAEFWNALDAHSLPAVSYLKPAGYQDGHAGYSDPLAEQTFLVETINRLQNSPEWDSTAVLILWDDSDGFYDHQMGPIVSQSHTPADALLGPGNAGNPPASAYQGRAGYGPRIPFLVISPYSKKNFVDHSIIDQSSVVRFIEDNWDLGRIGDQSFDAIAGTLHHMFDFDHGPHPHRLILDPSTGLPMGE